MLTQFDSRLQLEATRESSFTGCKICLICVHKRQRKTMACQMKVKNHCV
jgi:hypothetical protein